jgi:hypothetical protein
MRKNTKKPEILTNYATTDSLCLTIPLHKITILDNEFTNYFITYYAENDFSTGIQQQNRGTKFSKNGINIYFKLKDQYDFKRKITETYISITISSKLVRDNYFFGIQQMTWDHVYDSIMALEIIYCTKHTMLTAKINDIDICINRFIGKESDNSNAIIDLLKYLKESAIQDKYVNFFNQVAKNNVGLEFNTRSKATSSKPYVKFYHKQLELLYNSTEFYQNYLTQYSPKDLQNLLRVETTIKNGAHKRYLHEKGILKPINTLQDLFNAPQKDLYQLVCYNLSKYVTKQPKRLKTNTLSLNEIVLRKFIVQHLQNEMTISEIQMQYFRSKHIDQKKRKYENQNLKRTLLKIHDTIIHDDKNETKLLSANQEINAFLKYLQICGL